MKKGIAIFLTLCCFQCIIAQSHNRRVVIDMILTNSHHNMKKLTPNPYTRSGLLLTANAPSNFRFSDPIPKFCLPKGAFVCRFEEYVQLHTPMKLNIGLAGQ